MLDLLAKAEEALPALLWSNRVKWESVYIDYHEPTVERLWIPWQGIFRLSLHCIYPCREDQALFHPHPWPSAMKIVRGSYVMSVGYGTGTVPPPVAARIVAFAKSSYEMTHPDAWHYVAPIRHPAYTVMVTGRPWKRESPRAARPLRELDKGQKTNLLSIFMNAYPHHLSRKRA